MMSYHPVAQTIVDLLTEKHLWHETFQHEEVRTSEEAAKTREGYSLAQGAKALIVRVRINKNDKKFVMLVFPADLRFDSKKVKSLFAAQDIRFATGEEVDKLTEGVKVGGIPPFGNFFNLEVYVDPKLLENEKIVFNAGDRGFSVAMRSLDYIALVNPKVIPLTQ